MMSNERKRPWFQFHIQTLIAMTLTAGALLGAHMPSLSAHPVQGPDEGFSLVAVLVDIICSVFIFVWIACACEISVRRRANGDAGRWKD